MDWQYGLVPEQGRDPNVNAAIQMAVVLELWSRWWSSCGGDVVELMVPRCLEEDGRRVTKIIRKCSQIGGRMVRKWSQNGARMVLEAVGGHFEKI